MSSDKVEVLVSDETETDQRREGRKRVKRVNLSLEREIEYRHDKLVPYTESLSAHDLSGRYRVIEGPSL